MTKRRIPEECLPLTPAMFEVLIALADGEKHGYAVLKEVERRTDGNVVEDTESHCTPAFRMVTGRPHRAERRHVLAAADQVHRIDDCTCRMQRRFHRMSVERGVGIQVAQPAGRCRALDRLDVRGCVYARQLFARCAGRFVSHDVSIEAERDHVIVDRCEPLRAFRMIGSHLVQQARRVGDVRSGGHGFRKRG